MRVTPALRFESIRLGEGQRWSQTRPVFSGASTLRLQKVTALRRACQKRFFPNDFVEVEVAEQSE
jgi:hypothetical protein